MRGTILGFNDGRGTIQTDTDERYGFAQSDWRADEVPERGMAVDFVASGDRASDIYTALGARPAPAPLKKGSPLGEAPDLRRTIEGNDTVAGIVQRIRAAPQMVPAALLVILCIIAFARIGYENRQLAQLGFAEIPTEVSVLSLNREADLVRTRLDELVVGLEQRLDQADTIRDSSVGRSAEQIEYRRDLESAYSAVTRLDSLLAWSIALWLVPILAIAVLALGWTGYAWVRPAGMVLGAAAIATAFVPYLLQNMTIGIFEAMFSGDALITAKRAAQKAFELTGAGWLFGLAGVASIVLGVVRPGAGVQARYGE